MKRKCMIIVIVLGLLISSTASFADIDSKLKGHWSESMVEKDFIKTHFSYLFSNDDELFNPGVYTTKDNFISSLNSVIEEHGGEALTLEAESTQSSDLVTRKEAVILIVKAIEAAKDIQLSEADKAAFNDLTELNEEEILFIQKAAKLKIVNGYEDNTFRPNENVSQIQAILFLQRLQGELKMKASIIPFKVLDNESSHSAKEESVNVVKNDDKVNVTITKQFNTSGYSMDVTRIAKIGDDTFKIYLNIKKPDPNAMVLQAISYKTITIEIDKAELGTEDYKFEISSGDIDDIKAIR